MSKNEQLIELFNNSLLKMAQKNGIQKTKKKKKNVFLVAIKEQIAMLMKETGIPNTQAG